MRTPADRPTLLEEMKRLEAALKAPRLTSKKRMELLSRQAQVGDLRDALAQRARRAAQ